MATLGKRVTVAATATSIAAADSDGKFIVVKNGGTAIDLGDSTVTTGNGYPLAASEVFTITLGPGDDLYGITAAGTSIVSVLETRRG